MDLIQSSLNSLRISPLSLHNAFCICFHTSGGSILLPLPLSILAVEAICFSDVDAKFPHKDWIGVEEEKQLLLGGLSAMTIMQAKKKFKRVGSMALKGRSNENNLYIWIFWSCSYQFKMFFFSRMLCVMTQLMSVCVTWWVGTKSFES